MRLFAESNGLRSIDRFQVSAPKLAPSPGSRAFGGMRTYQVQLVGGATVFGSYRGESPDDAIEAMFIDAGYKSRSHAEEYLPRAEIEALEIGS